ncbi:MAG: hypothetical protein K2N27_03505 [Ruminococcus sp.]|nr:hypothetical protein [Ruminococcus sp.]
MTVYLFLSIAVMGNGIGEYNFDCTEFPRDDGVDGDGLLQSSKTSSRPSLIVTLYNFRSMDFVSFEPYGTKSSEYSFSIISGA